MNQTIALKDGLIINGTGSPGFYGSVLIKDNKISVIRQNSDSIQADVEIDCTGKVISPGFVDLHSHTGLTIFGEPKHEPKVFQGVGNLEGFVCWHFHDKSCHYRPQLEDIAKEEKSYSTHRFVILFYLL